MSKPNSQSQNNNNSQGKCKRPDFGTTGKKIQLLTNFFKVEFDSKKKIYQYDVVINKVFLKNNKEKCIEAKRVYKKDIIKKVFNENNLGVYAYDGNSILYSPNVLKEASMRTKFNADQEDSEFKVKLSQAATIELGSLEIYLNANSDEVPYAIINMLNIIMTQNEDKNIKIDKRCIYDLRKLIDLGIGIGYVNGHHLSTKVTQAGLMKNIDLACTSFYKPISLPDFFKEIDSRVDLNRTLTNDALREMEKITKGILVEPTHLRMKKTYIVRDLTKAASEFTVKKRGERNNELDITIAKCFESDKRPLKYPNMPCVKVIASSDPIYYPIELCQIATGEKIEPMLLHEFLQKINSSVDLSKPLTGDVLEDFKNRINDVIVEPIHLKKSKRYIIRDVTLPASLVTFKTKDNEKEISVAEYFKSTNRPLKYENMPCVKVITLSDPIYYPIELCRIASGEKIEPILLAEFLQKTNSGVDLSKPLTGDVLEDFKNKIYNLTIQPTHLQIRKKEIICGLTRPASELRVTKIDDDNNEYDITVAEYCKSEHIPLRYPNMPCVKIPCSEPAYLSIESCLFTDGENKSMLLTDFLKKLNSSIDFSTAMSDDDLIDFKNRVKNKIIRQTNLRKRYIIKDVTIPASQFKVKHKNENNEEQELTIAELYALENSPLKYENMPCVKVISNDPIYYPIEFCQIAPGQKYKKALTTEQRQEIITVTAVKPQLRKEQINELAKLNDLAFLRNFGITICESKMQEVSARVLNSPKVVYQNKVKEIDEKLEYKGTWLFDNSIKLFRAEELKSWAIVWLVKKDTRKFKRMQINEVKEKLFDFIQNVFESHGVKNAEPEWIDAERMNEIEAFASVQERIKNPQLVLFVINDNSQYEEIKHLAERDSQYGFVTQCMRLEKLGQFIENDSKLDNYLSNILLKVNAKLGGVNNKASYDHLVNQAIFKEPIMFVGADVTHHTFDETKPSISAVVASMDFHLTNYSVRLCEQRPKDEKKQSIEIILELEDIIFSLLSVFQRRNNGHLPRRMVFFRDGIDEGHFRRVREFEIEAIKRAYKRLNAPGVPAITFIIVQKRNNTRLFPIGSIQNKKGNVVSGTVVDTGITSINEFDFYLCSQDSGQGTAKPTHYWVIHDDNKFTSNDIQNLTYLLCHLYARCTKAVSIPAPVYYAHLAATRGRLHYNYEHDGESTDERIAEDAEIRSRLIEVHPDLKETMFFL